MESPAPRKGAGFFCYPSPGLLPKTTPHPSDSMPHDYLPVLLQVLIAIGFAVTVLGLSVVFGRSAKTNATKDSAYECGMLPIGEGAPRFSVKFYLVAMLFVIFDIEVVFMYPWAVQFRDLTASHGPVALLSMAGFAGILVFAYVYALKKGALNWKS
jgi:NADH-quinone oxidoreductase subunit A